MHHRPSLWPCIHPGVRVTGKANLNEAAGKAYTFLSQVVRNRWGKLGKPCPTSLKRSPRTFQTLPHPGTALEAVSELSAAALHCRAARHTAVPERGPQTGIPAQAHPGQEADTQVLGEKPPLRAVNLSVPTKGTQLRQTPQFLPG